MPDGLLPSSTPAEPQPPFAIDTPDGRSRAVVDAVLPAVDGGRFAAKCVAGEHFRVTAHVFTDGHDAPRVMLQWWKDGEARRRELPMKLRYNDEWHADFVPPMAGRYRYTVVAWVDAFESWRHELVRRVDADDIRLAARVGALEIRAAAARAAGTEREALEDWALALEQGAQDPALEAAALKALALDEDLAVTAGRYPDRRLEARYGADLPLVADRERARFSTWYELFPRSAGDAPGAHGTLRDVEARLPLVAAMGFDVLYFPPIHPIGRLQRKGRNNALDTEPGDVGSPWAIGAAEGGHKAILPALGTPEDFRHLVAAARARGLEIAMDIAFQCAPDHPYVKAHPQWFRWRPDGSVQYAENPPKKYQDIYPFNFESEDWQGLWCELKSVLDHWIAEGVTIFRVDNPHTKSFAFWEWAITECKRAHPELIFLAEAFTRPKVMHRLAKLGFTQSYTYFTWRNTKAELTDYFTELAQGPGADYFRPNVWPNTPDILHAALQGGEEAMFRLRLVLAATLAASYGIYGPAFELLEHLPRGPASEEYLDSEKYQLRHWDWDPDSGLRPFIARVNRIRQGNAALQSDRSLRFLDIDNDQLIAYLKASDDGRNVVVTIVNLDPHNAQWGFLSLDPSEVDVPRDQPFQMHDLLTDQRFSWQGGRHFIRLEPERVPAHVLVVRRRLRDERDFDYYL
ncbi:alpha-1,4-glucan--maltose-1-phosphate maltosyltransferase [Variovorax sp. J31P179]|uniref:alpha-1,4-glucan--maltose-1-phosphate maltosyltransferase n=1 Tax=Variovorax sp. J31P179 TaxID=3053508 RepID=UPI002576BC8C|nr:alpha-1,4-glucan--maltose-1-phosphate maltosyltransferase [Variovorax sp. J31P179]MDM0079164.1 alpha-1,4-glucan--maltose-1-phosphate maltosyltransferase [Variovorax sp. J31P179]